MITNLGMMAVRCKPLINQNKKNPSIKKGISSVRYGVGVLEISECLWCVPINYDRRCLVIEFTLG